MDEEPQTPGEYRYPDFLCIARAEGRHDLARQEPAGRHPGLWLPPDQGDAILNHLYLPQSRNWTTRQRQERGAQQLRRYIEKTSQEEWDYRLISVMADIAASPVSDQWYGRIFSLAAAGQVCGEVTPDYATLPDEGIRHVLKLSAPISARSCHCAIPSTEAGRICG